MASSEAVEASPVIDESFTRRRRGWCLLVLFLIAASNYADRNIISVLLEPIRHEFQVSDTQLGLLSGLSFAFFYATLGIPVARWADRGNRKTIITIALSLWSVMTALCGAAQTFWQLVAARIGVGVGEAGAIPPAQSLLADYYPPAERGRALGVFMTSSTGGYVIALVFGGWVAQNYGWRAAFIAVAAVGLLVAPLAHFVLREPRAEAKSQASTVATESLRDAVRSLATKPSYRLVVLGIVLYFLVAYGALTFTVSFLIRSHGLSVAQAGALTGAIHVIGALIGSVGAGMLSDRLAKRDIGAPARVAAFGLLLAAPSYWLALSTSSPVIMGIALATGSIMLHAVTLAQYSSLHTVCGTKRRAMAVAIAFFFANLLGLGLGPLLTGIISDRFAVDYGAADGLRYAIMCMFGMLLPTAWVMFRVARNIQADVER
ncbi:MAG TPA: MFS transporter [Steroidobacteraceae bacterium]|nr:MFS transporter [Steroidobacteraceae bacterium]